MSEIDYIRVGDYYLPNIVLKEPPQELTEPIAKYGAIRQSFLATHRPILYNSLLLSERLYPHLREVDKIATERWRHGVSEEVILSELVYE